MTMFLKMTTEVVVSGDGLHCDRLCQHLGFTLWLMPHCQLCKEGLEQDNVGPIRCVECSTGAK